MNIFNPHDPLYIRPLRLRRGTMLLAFMFLLPMVMGLLLLMLSRLDVNLKLTQRHEGRVQARLLAESALSVYGQSREPLQGEIAGVGEYEIRSIDSNGKIEARGVAWQRYGSGSIYSICTIRAEISDNPTDAPRLIAITYNAETRDTPPPKPPI